MKVLARLGYMDYAVISPESMFTMNRPLATEDGQGAGIASCGYQPLAIRCQVEVAWPATTDCFPFYEFQSPIVIDPKDTD